MKHLDSLLAVAGSTWTRRGRAWLCAGMVAAGSSVQAAPLLAQTFGNGLGSWSQTAIYSGATDAWTDSSDFAVVTVSNVAPNVTKTLVTPSLNLSNTTNPTLFIMHRESCSSANVELNVYYQEDNSGTWTALQSLDASTTEKLDRVFLNNGSSVYKLGFEARNVSSSPCMISIDEIAVGSANEVLVTGVHFSGISHDLVSNESVVQPVGATNGSISLTVPYGQSRAALTPLFVGLVGDVTPSGSQDLSSVKSFTVQSYDKTASKTYDLVVNWTAPSTAADLTGLKLCQNSVCNDSIRITAPAGNVDTGVVQVYFQESFPVAQLTSTLTVSSKATASTFPASGPFDLSESGTGLVVTVTAQDGATKHYYRIEPVFVPVVLQLADIWLCDPDNYGVPSRSIWDPATAADTGRVEVDLPVGIAANKYRLCEVDVETGVVYTTAGSISAQGNGLTVKITKGYVSRVYAVNANVRKTADAQITVNGLDIIPPKAKKYSPNLAGVVKTQASASAIGSIEVVLDPGSSVDDFSAYNWYFGLSDPFAYIEADDGNAASYWGGTTSRVFTTTTENLKSSFRYRVNIKYEDRKSSAQLVDFVIWLGQLEVYGTIDTAAGTVVVDLPLEANLARLKCAFATPQNATASIGSMMYYDFTTPLTFEVISADQSTTKEYTVTVNPMVPAPPVHRLQSGSALSNAMHASLDNGMLTVQHDELAIDRLAVFDIHGQVVAQRPVEGGSRTEFDLRSQANGIYFLKAYGSASLPVVRLIKK